MSGNTGYTPAVLDDFEGTVVVALAPGAGKVWAKVGLPKNIGSCLPPPSN